MDLELTESAEGTLLRLRVTPGARRDAIVGHHGGALKVRVAAAPEGGKANRAVLALLAAELGLPPSALTLLRGDTRRDKLVSVPLAPREIVRRLSRGTKTI